MSRNLRRRSTPTPPKKQTRRLSGSTATSDDDYGGVDLISDSEEDEPDVEEAEEQAIIESEEEDDDDDIATPRPSIDDDEGAWEGFDMTSQEDVLNADGAFFDDHIARMNKPDVDTQMIAWNATNGKSDDENTPEARRVRFDIGSESSSSLSDDEENIFPDIFLDQNSLDPDFRKYIEKDENDDLPSSDNGSYWDFGGSDGEPIPIASGDDDDDSDTSIGTSGYETDEGETTEEDLPPAAKYIPGRSTLPRQHVDSSDSEDEDEIPVIRRKFRPASRGPKLGNWVHDRSKPFAVLDTHGKKLIMFRAKPRRFSFNGTRSQAMGFIADGVAQTPGAEHMSPLMSDPANLMMSAMFTPLDNALGGQALGPPEAFYPFTSVSTDGTVIHDNLSSYDEDDMDDEDLWNVEDFVDFGDNSSDEEGGAEDDSGNTTADPLSSTPVRPTTKDSEAHALLNHLKGGIVGAFRRNQHHHQLLSRNAATRESLAFSGPYGQGTLRGIKKGSLAAANTPITPMRRQKLSKAGPLGSSPGSPLAAAANQRKRKFSGEAPGHKRSRSLI